MSEQEEWARAVREFSCPFCGRAKGSPCHRMNDARIFGEGGQDLVKPHENRLRLLTETDPAIRGSFS